MLSTYLGYTVVNRDMQAALNRVASQNANKNDIDYYNKHIGKITSVDDFMKDYRLYNYATKAFGLDDMAYAKAFIKKVLESDLSDENSFANRLSDARYRQFAAAFTFGGNGTKDVQSDEQEDEVIGLYKQYYDDQETSAKTESTYYKSKIDKVKTVGALLSDPRLKNYMLQAVGIDPTYVSKDFLKSVLTSDLDDPTSVANVVGATKAGAPYKQLASMFGFKADGTLDGDTAQTADQRDSLIETYNLTVPTFTTFTAASYNKAYYEAHIGSVTSAADLAKDARLFSYVKTAYGMDSKLSAASFSSIMKSDPNDPHSFANVLGYGYVVSKFSFLSNGNTPTGGAAQTADQIKATTAAYMSKYTAAENTFVDGATSNYKARTESGIKTIDDFFISNKTDKIIKNDSQPELRDMVLRAYGIDPTTVSNTQLRKVMTSDPYDPKSYVNSLKDDRFVSLAKAFNFDSDGKITAPLQALDPVQVSTYATDDRHKQLLGLTGAALAAAKKQATTDADYFKENIVKVKTAADFLGDKKLVSFVLEAKGLDPKDYDSALLKKAFAADPDDKKSILNDPANAKLKDIVMAFNFDQKGNLVRSGVGDAQSDSSLATTNSLYLHQTLEQQQGEQNDGVRLALYFQRKAPDISSIYDLMGDKALFQVITTTFSLPSAISSMDVDQQAALLKHFVNIKDLQDPDKLNRLIQRFTAMYDQTTKSTQSPALSILGGNSSGISADTLLSIAQLRAR